MISRTICNYCQLEIITLVFKNFEQFKIKIRTIFQWPLTTISNEFSNFFQFYPINSQINVRITFPMQ